MSAHTPGPWAATVMHGESRSIIAVMADGPTQVATMREGSFADARIIAAAPDLLAALERIANHEWRADRRKRGMIDVFEVETLARIARAAIAKAKGREG